MSTALYIAAALLFAAILYRRGYLHGRCAGIAEVAETAQAILTAEHAECQQILADFMAAQEVER